MVGKWRGFSRIDDGDPLLLQFFASKKGGRMQQAMTDLSVVIIEL